MTAVDALRDAYRDPPWEHSPRPFWFWNGELTPEEVQRQIAAMVEQHVYGAYVHCRSGMKPRYLTPEWWELVRAATAKARDLGFALCVVDEYNWPSGDACDYLLPDAPSRVLARDRVYRMRSLVPRLEYVPGAAYVTTGRRDGDGALALDSWRVADGPADLDEVVCSFTLEDAVGFDGGLVDLLNPDAVAVFIEEVYAAYRVHLGDEFGRTFRATFIDHEGDYGYRLAWTPAFRKEFQARKGYDIVPCLVALLADAGPRSVVVRCDYFDVVADLYSENFFGQISRWGERHGVQVSGHTWEESLHAAAAFAGDHLRIQRAVETPGIDTLFNWGRSPRHFIEARSVAHARSKGLVVENQGVQGADNYLSPERIKRTTNTIAVWGATQLIPHAFNGAKDRIDFPEDWFERQPWWPWFSAYADHARRLSFVNTVGTHVADVALYYPIESVWANGDPCFDSEKWNYIFDGADDFNGPRVTWHNPADETDRVYGEIIERLPLSQWDLDIVDAHMLDAATFEDGALRVGEETFQLMIMPPMTCIRLSALQRLVAFAEAGGTVVWVGRTPTDSMESGRDDPDVGELLARLAPTRLDSVDELLELLDERIPRRLDVVEGHASSLRAAQRRIDGAEVFLLVNDADNARRYGLHVPKGIVEVWDPEAGTGVPLAARPTDGDGMRVDLKLRSGQAVHLVVLHAAEEQRAPAESCPEPSEELRLEPIWQVRLRDARVPIPYARSRAFAVSAGLQMGAHLPEANDRFWDETWLSPESWTLRDWWVIGPFDYDIETGYRQVHPPEREQDLAAEYEGKHGAVRWQRHVSETREVDLDGPLGIAKGAWGGMHFKSAYALTHVWSPESVHCELRFVPDANGKAWLNGELIHAERDDHQGYLELRDAYGYRLPVELQAGWNTLLLKVGQAVRYGGIFGFVARFCDASGRPLPSLHVDAEQRPAQEAVPEERWYRFALPAGTTGVELVASGDVELYVDGRQVEPRAVDAPGDAVVAVRVVGGALLDMPLAVVGPARRLLGSLTHTPLSPYCGLVDYEQTFTLPAEWGDGAATLDLGEVGVVAEAELNGLPLGRRPWSPFVFDLRDALREGENHLRVTVGNTLSQERARGHEERALWDLPVRGPALLDGIEANGLMGPVRVLRAR